MMQWDVNVVVVKASDLRSKGHRFDWLFNVHVVTLGKLFICICNEAV